MREMTLKQFFLGEISAEVLARDVDGSVVQIDSVTSSVRIEDMRGHFVVEREHVVKLCDATVSRELPPESLSAITFALFASDAFEWDDDVMSEVLADWSAPEINYPLNEQTLAMHRSWLQGLATRLNDRV
jgi:hypothetical protein